MKLFALQTPLQLRPKDELDGSVRGLHKNNFSCRFENKVFVDLQLFKRPEGHQLDKLNAAEKNTGCWPAGGFNSIGCCFNTTTFILF